jgi:glutathione synthase
MLTVAIQMDPIERIDIGADSTFALCLEAQRRGHRLLYYGPRDLSLRGQTVLARVRAMTVRDTLGDHVTLGEAFLYDLSQADVVLMRQDPPFDMGYITATHILDFIHPKTLVVNDPSEVRNAPEKLFVTTFKNVMPPTLISFDREEIRAFRAEHSDIILKPLYGNGGAGVFRVKKDDENINALLDMFAQFYREPVMVQRYIPEVRKGDKRIILVDGEAVGGFNRVPPEGEARSNLHIGGRAEASELTKRDREICAIIGPELKKRGLIFTGIDVIGDYLTEINVTSPTGIHELRRLSGIDSAPLVWDAIERRIAARKKA